MKDYPAELAALDTAIELQPADAYNFAWRGRICFELDEVTKASADFAQVEALLGENGRPAGIPRWS